MAIDKEKVLREVNKALEAQFDTFSWSDMINCCDDLSPEEKAWAKENTGYQAYICE